ncbi:hypothetical protein JXA80_03940, partial [bacterium]|nr:hypothetical protein [candidate division CSSED10-310 bacterium]
MQTPLETLIMAVASLMIPPFSAGFLARVLNRPERGVRNALGRLIRRGTAERIGPGGRYRLIHKE